MKNRFRLALLTATFTGMIATTAVATPADKPHVQFDTNMGSFVVELEPKAAPKTVANFMQYVKSGFYQGTIFHRVIPGFMIQGGGMNESMEEKDTKAPIALESRNG